MRITGLSKVYTPGDAISAVITLDNFKEGDMAIISSNICLKRREGIRYTSIPCPCNKFLCTTWDVRKNHHQRIIAEEESGLNLFNRVIGKGRTTFNAQFHVPLDVPNSSVVPGVYGNTHYNEYFVHVQLALSRGGVSWTLERDIPFRVMYRVPTNTSSIILDMKRVGVKGGISSMVRCSTHTFLPGKEFDILVANINNTGKTIRKMVAYFSQTVRVVNDDIENKGPSERRTGKLIQTIPRGGRSDTDFVETMTHVLECGCGTHFRLSVPTDFIRSECKNASVLQKHIVVKFYFYTGSSCETRFDITG